MKNRKGVSPVISYVLLLGLAVAMGLLVTSWYLRTTESQAKQILEEMEGGTLCESIDAGFGFSESKVNIKNIGKFTINKVIMSFSKSGSASAAETRNYEDSIAPGITKEGIIVVPEGYDTMTFILYSEQDDAIIKCSKDREYNIL